MGNFLLGLFGNLLAAEIGAWCRGLAQKIVHATAQKLPEKLQPRMLEEWNALLNDIPGDLSKLWMAISLFLQRSALADECEKLIEEPLPSLVGIETLTELEHNIFALHLEGKTAQEIRHILNIDPFWIEYRTITSVQKLTGQSSIGRADLLKFLGTVKIHRNKVRDIVRRFQREMLWRRTRIQLERSERRKRRGDWNRWRRNRGW